MDINKIRDGGELTIALTGSLNTQTAPELDEAVKTDLDGVTLLVLDLDKLDYISSAGLRVLLCAQDHMDDAEGTLIVKNANETVREVFDMTGFTDILALE